MYFHVLCQLKTLTEPPFTLVTCVEFLAGVILQVPVQLSRRPKTPFTPHTSEGLLASVDHPVCLQITNPSKSPSTNVTHVPSVVHPFARWLWEPGVQDESRFRNVG